MNHFDIHVCPGCGCEQASAKPVCADCGYEFTDEERFPTLRELLARPSYPADRSLRMNDVTSEFLHQLAAAAAKSAIADAVAPATFTLFWKDGRREVLVGRSLADAFGDQGFGVEALDRLAFYERGDSGAYRWDPQFSFWRRAE